METTATTTATTSTHAVGIHEMMGVHNENQYKRPKTLHMHHWADEKSFKALRK